MANLSNSNPFTNVAASTAVNIPRTPTFSDFQFKTIGQPPDLLKRMTTVADTNTYTYEHSEKDVSMSPEPDFVSDAVLPPQPSEQEPEVHKHRSLRERMAIPDEDIIMDENSFNVTESPPANIFSWKSTPVASRRTTAIEDDSIIHSPNASPLAGTSHQRGIFGAPVVPSPKQPEASPVPAIHDDFRLEKTDIPNVLQSSQPQIRAPSVHLHIATEAVNLPTFGTLRDLQIRLATSLANLNPITTSNALSLAQSVNERYSEVAASAERAYMLGQKALKAAEESMGSAKECLTLAETLQSKTDEVLDALAKIDNDGQKEIWNKALQTLKSGLHDLDRWGRQMETQRQSELHEMETERRIRAAVVQHEVGPSGIRRTPPTIASAASSLPSLIPTAIPLESSLMTVEHEAVAITEAWNQIREQSAERRRIAADELRKRRENEERLEREQNEASAALAAARAERIQAEKAERARQEKENEEAEIRQQELARKREAALQRKASEERALRDADAKNALLQAQREEKKREELLERETLQKRLDAEKARAREAELQRQLHEQQIQEQQHKRQEIANQKQRAAANEAKRIQSDRAKSKQSVQTTTPPNQTVMLPGTPISPSSNYESLLHVQFPTQHNISNPSNDIVHGRNKAKADQGTSEGADSGSFLNRIAASASSSSAPASSENWISSLPSRVLPDTSPIGHPGPGPRTASAQSTPLPNPLPVEPAGVGSRHNFSFPSTNSMQTGAAREDITRSIPRGGKLDIPEVQHLPPSGGLPTVHSTYLDAQADNHPKLYVRNGQDLGNVALIPCSQIPPISGAAQKANLRYLVSAKPEIKTEPEDVKHFIKTERNPTPPILSLPPSSSSQNDVRSKNAIDVRPLNSRRERKLSTGIPLLSLPSPIAPREVPSIETMPTNEQVAETESNSQLFRDAQPLGKKVIPGHGLQVAQSTSHITAAKTHPNQSAVGQINPRQFAVGPKEGAVANARMSPKSVVLDTPSLPAPGRIPVDNPPSVPRPSDLMDRVGGDLPSRMGPDTMPVDSWVQANATQERTYAPAPDYRYARVRSPPLQLREVDHWSPSPANVLPDSRYQQRNRIPPNVDHYSPHPRSPSPPPSYPSYAMQRPVARSRSDSRGIGSANNSRAGTPEQPMYQHQASRQPLPLKRKRPHLADQTNEPPIRRPRYDAQSSREADYSTHPGDWSHVANYSRSPTPEVQRATPLHMRLSEDDRRPQPQASNYRHNGFPNRQRPELQHRPFKATVYSNESSAYQTNNVPRQNPRHTPESRPPLLDRFTDQIPYSFPNNHTHHTTSVRGNRPRGRGGAHQQPLGARSTKGPLINRLQAQETPDDG